MAGDNPLLPDLSLGIPWDQAKQLIFKYESGGGQNIYQTAYSGQGINPSTGTHTPPSSAQGPFQIENSTWAQWAPRVGVSLAAYPTAMAAPVEVQEQVAKYGYQRSGWSPWAPYNKTLARAIGWQGAPAGQSPGPSQDIASTLAKPADVQTSPQDQLQQAATSPSAVASPPESFSPALLLAAGLLRGVKFTPVDYDPMQIYKLASIGGQSA